MKKSLFGYGLTTKAIAKSGGWDIYDDSFTEIMTDELDNSLLPPNSFDPQKSTLEVPSPGFPRTHNLILCARNLISEYDYFKSIMPKSIWISGTNGKTTTTQMTQFLLEQYGSVMGGNVGTPLAELDKNAKIWILETSSFTIFYTKFARPDIYALLPITPDHLSWHGNIDEYIRAKLKPLSMMQEGSVAIIPKKYANTTSNATILAYENEEDLSKICGVDISQISFKMPFLMDALMALCLQKIIFDRADFKKLNNFKIEENKLEELHDFRSRLWVNDTKATNLDATIQALKRYQDNQIHLILGGDDKGVSLEPLFTEIKKHRVKIYAIGSNTEKIINLCEKFNIASEKCFELQRAVECINKMLKNGEVALLSPACASLDQFGSYAQRGDKFKEFIKNLA